MTYRAAYIHQVNGLGQDVITWLTLPEHSTLPDIDLIAEATVHAREIGIYDLKWDDIKIGNWNCPGPLVGDQR